MAPESRDAEDNLAKISAVAPADTLSPADRYQELFVAVQTGRVFADSKTFVDCAPLDDPETILERYRVRASEPGFDLAAFVHEHFVEEHPPQSEYVANRERTLLEHIDYLWGILTREPREHPTRSSLLPLPNHYVVPGGRFGEMYYWDSYFTMLGVARSGRLDLVRGMADNFAYLVDTFGHIPNGNRSYYLSRSQPPLFALMTELFEDCGATDVQRFLPRLRKEYAYWMEGSHELRNSEAHRHCVRMPDGSLLNRYWDDRDTPREESHLEDVTTAAAQSSRPVHEVYRELRAGAASGWDFSSRWCGEDCDLSTIRTTAVIPVDLNAFLYKLETRIAELGRETSDEHCASEFSAKAAARCQAIERWLWDESVGTYRDYDWRLDRPRPGLSAAVAAPLFVGVAQPQHAARTAKVIRDEMLAPGGLMTTGEFSDHQWDRPNGWAPLQWMAITGLRHYGETELAADIGRRWMATIRAHFEREGKLVEKYELHPSGISGVGGHGGEYPLQDGFGWTNGVVRMLLGDESGAASARTRRRARNR